MLTVREGNCAAIQHKNLTKIKRILDLILRVPHERQVLSPHIHLLSHCFSSAADLRRFLSVDSARTRNLGKPVNADLAEMYQDKVKHPISSACLVVGTTFDVLFKHEVVNGAARKLAHGPGKNPASELVAAL